MAVEHRLITTELFTPDQRDEIENSPLPRGSFPESHQRGVIAARIFIRNMFESSPFDTDRFRQLLSGLVVESRKSPTGVIVDTRTFASYDPGAHLELCLLYPHFIDVAHDCEFLPDDELTSHLQGSCSREFPGTVPVPSLPTNR